MENCGILQNLLPGDTVLADGGFNIKEFVAIYQANMNIPAFTEGKSQLDPIKVEQTRQIVNIRIHMERLIGSIPEVYVP